MKLQTLRTRLKPQNINIVLRSNRIIFIASTEKTPFDDHDIASIKIDQHGVFTIAIKE